jgi:hypothetical protein
MWRPPNRRIGLRLPAIFTVVSLGCVKTVRFSHVVASSGTPRPLMVLTDPEKDKELQGAIRAHKVMTVFQDSVGARADRAIVGFEPGRSRQFLIFPKSLTSFEGRKVVGIKYELWEQEKLATLSRKELVPSKSRAGSRKPVAQPSNVIAFHRPGEETQKSEATKPMERKRHSVRRSNPPKSQPALTDTKEIKRHIHKAMALLEAAKPVAAFNLLKEIADSIT